MNNHTTPKSWGGHLILCPPPSKSCVCVGGGRGNVTPAPRISAHAKNGATVIGAITVIVA